MWDPLSKTQTSLLVLFVQRLVDEFPTLQKQSKNTEVPTFAYLHVLMSMKRTFIDLNAELQRNFEFLVCLSVKHNLLPKHSI